jgi:hypothetical protein
MWPKSATLRLVIPAEAKRSGGTCGSLICNKCGLKAPPSDLSSRPERTRISYLAKTKMATYAAFLKESRTNFANATKFNRKSGAAKRRDLLSICSESNGKVYRTELSTSASTSPYSVGEVSSNILERETGIEPATNGLGSRYSTIELLPPMVTRLFYP